MELRPSRIYENYRNKSLDKLSVIRLLIALIENNDDDTIRKDCIDILKKIDSNEEEIFKVSENILLSESNDDLRSSAATVIGKKFLKRSLNPFLWVLQYETSYKCLITIIMTFQNNSDSQIISKFAEELREIPVDKFSNCLGSFLKECKDNELTSEKFVENLINHITITYLKKKFKKLNFKMDNGLVTELDFSEVDNLIINWRDRENLQDHSIIAGIINLKALKKVEFFPFKWVINNEFTFKSSIALLKVLERMNNNTSRDTLIYQIKNITDDKFNLSISTFLTPYQFLPRSKLTNIFRNYLTLSFLKKKYSSLEYKIIDGEVVSIYLRGETIISLPNFIKYLSSLRSISLKHCSLYTIPKSIGTFSNLKILDLEGNNLKVIPKTISSLESLRLLNLKNNQLIKLPYEFGKLMFLQYLNLEANNLIRLPSSLGNLSLLKYLSVKDNKLHELPSSIGNLKSLQVLCLSSNKLNQLPYSIGLLTSLELLNLDNNNLRELPTSINSLSSLKTLSIEDNNLTNLPKSLDLLKSLE
ncbi:MAG: leucine-rich repeat domain-containing protein, partial [Candidatus Thorarchaeota archaeon]